MDDDDPLARDGSRCIRRQTYPISLKLIALDMLKSMTLREVADKLALSHSNVRNWKRVAASLATFKGNKKSVNLPGAGRPTMAVHQGLGYDHARASSR